MNSAQWATFSALGGGRPINPRAVQAMGTKAWRGTSPKGKTTASGKSASATRAARRAIVAWIKARHEFELAKLPPPVRRSRQARRAATTMPSVWEMAQPGPAGIAAQLRHAAVVQRYHKPF